jgi:hypothetical protein
MGGCFIHIFAQPTQSATTYRDPQTAQTVISYDEADKQQSREASGVSEGVATQEMKTTRLPLARVASATNLAEGRARFWR